MPDGVLHIICSRRSWQNCIIYLKTVNLPPSQILLTGYASLILLLEDENSYFLHDLAATGVVVTVMIPDLTLLGLFPEDFPAYIFAVASFDEAVSCAVQQQLTVKVWP